MNAGDALVAAGAAAAGATVLGAVLAARRPEFGRVADRAAPAAALLLGGATLWLALHFLLGWTDVLYVWERTLTSYPWWYRLAGLWAGQKGTILLWAALLAVVLAVESARARRRGDPEPQRRAAQAFLALAVLGLALLAAVERVFAPTGADLLRLQPQGQGLLEVLVTPLMVVHPPVQFVAYALLAAPAALAFAGLWTGGRAWLPPALAWARGAWLLATTGLGLGALWAYYVLSFGGFWAWDPVETGNLLPWLALTAFLHAAKAGDGVGTRVARPLLALAGFALTLFATLVTRSGLWASVHAFTDPANRFEPDAAARFLAILDLHAPSAWFASMLALTLVLASAAFARALLRERPVARPWLVVHGALLALVAGALVADPAAAFGALLEAGRAAAFGRAPAGLALLAGGLLAAPALALYLGAPETAAGGARADAWRWVRPRPLLTGAILLLSLALVVTLVLAFATVNAIDRAPFDARAPLVATPVVLLVAVAFGHRVVGARAAVLAAAAALATGVGLAFAFPDVWPLALGAPPLALAFVAVLARATLSLRGRVGRAETAAGASLLLGSVLGVVMWANPPHHVLGVATGFPTGFAMMAVAALGVPAAVAALGGHSRRVALVGAVAVAAAAGYGVGLLLGLGALAFLLRAPAAPAAPRWGRSLRRAGVHVAHLGLVVALLGYAGATYAGEAESFTLAPGETAEVGGVGLALVGIEGERFGGDGPARLAEDVPYRRVAAVLAVSDGDTARSAFEWRPAPVDHYDPVLDVRRGLFRDVYVSPRAFEVEGLGALREHEAPPLEDWHRFTPEGVRTATFDVVVLPLMSLVWGGLWLLVLAMTLVLAGAEKGGTRPREAGVETPDRALVDP